MNLKQKSIRKFFFAAVIVTMIANFLFVPLTTMAQNMDPAHFVGSGGDLGVAVSEANPNPPPATESCNFFWNPISCSLLAVLKVGGWLIDASDQIFQYSISPSIFSQVAGNGNRAIYDTWAEVRDFLNVAFILVLLFSAFATIFQVEKYSYKKILLWLIIMALLVNFSFPITRFIIDISNSLMYTLLSRLSFGGDPSHIITNITQDSNIKDIIVPQNGTKASVALLLASVIFIFILAITFLALGILLVIRMIALAILIIFSPVAFVGSIIGKGKQWWDYLFKYAFFGPIMIFMLSVAMAVLKNSIKIQFTMQGVNNKIDNPINQHLTGAMAAYSIPIVILWIGMGVAQKMGIAGAAAVTGQAQKFAKWVPNAIFKATGVPGGVKKAADYYGKKGAPLGLNRIPGLRGSEKTEATEAWWASKLGVKGAKDQDMKKRAEEYKKENADTGMLKDRCSKGDAAACYRLADDGFLDSKEYNDFSAKNKDAGLQKTLNSKVKKNRVDLLINYRMNSKKELDEVKKNNKNINTDEEAREFIAKDEIGKLNPEKWGEQYWKDIMKDPSPEIKKAVEESYSALAESAQEDIKKRLNPNNAAALREVMTGQKTSGTKRPVGFNR